MGLTYVRMRLSKDAKGAPRPLRLLVDTGATYSMVPRRVLESLHVVPEDRVLVRLGDGRLVERDLGLAFVRYRKYATPTWVMFGERGDAAVLGALTLEELRLQIDPQSQRLREIKVALLVSMHADRVGTSG